MIDKEISDICSTLDLTIKEESVYTLRRGEDTLCVVYPGRMYIEWQGELDEQLFFSRELMRVQEVFEKLGYRSNLK